MYIHRFQEMQFVHIRALAGDGSVGADPAQSTLTGMGSMTIQPGSMLTIQPGSMATTPPLPTSPPSMIADSSECVPPDLSNSPSTDIAFKLEVETRSGETTLVENLAAGMVSSLATSFSLCVPSGNRLLTGRNLQGSVVTGLAVSDKSGISQGTFINPLFVSLRRPWTDIAFSSS
jgi:hypothetical protein